MKTFKVKLVSQPHAIAFVVVVLICVFTEAAIFFPLNNKSLAIPLTVLEFAFAIFLWQKFVTGRTEWTVDSDQIIIKWTKKFAFSKLKDFNFKWDRIEKISKGFDPGYYNLKIRFTSGETIIFYHDYLTTRDDFEDLIKILYKTYDAKKIQSK